MLHYYLLLFVRNIKRQKLFSFINLFGLTISITSTLLIYLYVQHEFSYDRFHNHADRIYRVNQTFIWGEDSNNQFASTGPGVAHALKEELPEVELITSIHTPGNFIISYTNQSGEVKSFEEDKILAADSNFFKMFNFPLIKGEAQTALIQAQTLIMTESTAKKYFGDEEPIGKLVRLGEGENQKTFEVTGIAKDTPENSYIEFDVLLSMNSIPAVGRLHWSWIWTQLETYVRLAENTDVNATLAKLQTIPRKHAEETLQRIMNTSFDEYIKSGKKWELFLQPITSIHLPSTVVLNRLSDSGDIKIIYSLIGAGIFIVLLSCVNFMNLSTAQFTRRIKEASIRKVLGLDRISLGLGYFFEALIFCTLALIAALALTQVLLPGFNMLLGKVLEVTIWTDFTFFLSVMVLIVLMSIVCGFYPAIFLSAFHPVEAMKGRARTGGNKFRNGLVIFQFTVSIVLIVCTAIVFQQLDFVSKKDLGFEKENLMVLTHVESLKNGEALTTAALNIPGVTAASWCTSVPPTVWGGDKFKADEMSDRIFSLNYTSADERFIPTLGIKMKLGRNFSKENPGDANGVILNQEAVLQIGWKLDESVIGKKIFTPGSDVKFEVVGVVDDFHYWSLATPIEPMAIFSIHNAYIPGMGNKQYLALRIARQDSEAWEATIASLTLLWKQHAGDTPFQYQFVDQAFAETFKSQQQFGNALTVLALLAMMIACLGLLGMIIYTLEQRTKEIGIRKVSGASAWNILLLISKGYSKLIIVAFVLGSPLSYWMMEKWLQGFAFRIEPSFWIFVCAGMGTLALAILITSYHSVKAAQTNPVDILKDE